MPARGFSIQTLTGSAVPVFGTTLAAALVVTPDAHTGNTQPASQRSSATATLTAGILRKGDRVLVGTAAEIVAGTCDSASVGNVSGLANVTAQLQGLTRSHGSGDLVVLAMSVAALQVLAVTLASTDVIYLGEDNTAASNSATLIDVLGATNLAWRLGPSAVGNVFDTQHLWVNGTSGDKFLASFVTV